MSFRCPEKSNLNNVDTEVPKREHSLMLQWMPTLAKVQNPVVISNRFDTLDSENLDNESYPTSAEEEHPALPAKGALAGARTIAASPDGGGNHGCERAA